MQALLFDLDGTLADPFAAINASLQYALQEKGLPPVDESKVRNIIGPPLQQSWGQLTGLADESLFQELMTLYRKHHEQQGLALYTLYPGIPEALALVQKTAPNLPLFVATSKPHVFAKTILHAQGVAHFFRAIEGPELDGTRSQKTELLQSMIQHHQLTPEHCVLVGDRKYDTVAAHNVGMKSVGVLWGFGTREELQSHFATSIVATIPELPEHLITNYFKD